MDGKGPPNQWAHGQGSFSKDTIIKWIYRNKFRGKVYRSNIQMYINSIININVECFNLISFCERHFIEGIDLLILDVQGAEAEILSVLPKLRNKPRVIIYEDESSMKTSVSKALEKFLTKIILM